MSEYATTKVVLNRYVLKEQLGSGGMSTVYAATDEQSGQQLAIKRLPLQEVDEKARKHLEREDWPLVVSATQT